MRLTAAAKLRLVDQEELGETVGRPHPAMLLSSLSSIARRTRCLLEKKSALIMVACFKRKTIPIYGCYVFFFIQSTSASTFPRVVHFATTENLLCRFPVNAPEINEG